MQGIDPIFVAPRFVERDWGRSDLGDWRADGQSPVPVAEAWICDPANPVESGTFGECLARTAVPMLGDLGRAPPKLRLIFPAKTKTIPSTSPLSFWTILEPGVAAGPETEAFHKPGERIRAHEGAEISLPGGSIALEVSSTFQPGNQHDDGPSIIRLPPVSARTRATLFRDAALSVERWRLPAWSRLVPDGATCHVVMALTDGVRIDGRRLRKGEAVFIPAMGRATDIAAQNFAAVLVAYPDTAPTSIWRHTPGPDPASNLAIPLQSWPWLNARGDSLPKDEAA